MRYFLAVLLVLALGPSCRRRPSPVTVVVADSAGDDSGRMDSLERRVERLEDICE